MKIDYSNLDWNNAKVTDGRYLYYLAMMLYERTNLIGYNKSNFVYAQKSINFNISNYTPEGIFRFSDLYEIYKATIKIGLHVYFNQSNLTSGFENKRLRKPLGSDLNQLCEIANFDFYQNPLIPNQRLDYYDKFLKPLYTLLKSYKKIYINCFNRTGIGFKSNASFIPPKVIKNNIEQDMAGPEWLQYQNLDYLISSEISASIPWEAGDLVGGYCQANYVKSYWFGYLKDDWVPDPGPGPTPPPPDPEVNGEWVFDFANAEYHNDGRHPNPMPTESTSKVDIYYSCTPVPEFKSISWSLVDAQIIFYDERDGDWIKSGEQHLGDPGVDPNMFWQICNVDANWYSNGRLTMSFARTALTKDPDSATSITNVGTISKSGEEAGSVCQVGIKFQYYDPQYNTSNSQTITNNNGHYVRHNEYDYAENYQGIKWLYYRIFPSGTYQAPCVLPKDCSYDLYLYSCPTYDQIGLYYAINPSGNYYLYDSGTITSGTQTFEISLDKYFFTNNIFNNYPVSALYCHQFSMVDYVPYSYDSSFWSIGGTTPTENWAGIPLTSGRILYHNANVEGQRTNTTIGMFYAPLLIINVQNQFKYN